jgi:hypothetical protein
MCCRYGGVDPLRVLLSAEERWQLLNRLDVDRPNAQPAAHYYERRVDLPPVWYLGRARRVCGDANVTVAHGGEEPGDAGGLGRLPPPRTHFAQSLDCAVRLARGLAASRASAPPRGGAGGSAGGGGARAGGWRLHVASDAPGLTAMLARLPGLEGQVVGCLHPHCYEHGNAAAQHSQRARAHSNDSLQAGGPMRTLHVHVQSRGATRDVGLQSILPDAPAHAHTHAVAALNA